MWRPFRRGKADLKIDHHDRRPFPIAELMPHLGTLVDFVFVFLLWHVSSILVDTGELTNLLRCGIFSPFSPFRLILFLTFAF